MAKIFIDAENAIVGRMGSYAAKQLLKGDEVVIINAEKAIISGTKVDIMGKIVTLRKKGGSSQKGPQVSKMPDRLLKRMLRGMLPWDKTRGREAFRRLRCYVSGAVEAKEIKNAKKFEFATPERFMTIKQISDLLE